MIITPYDADRFNSPEKLLEAMHEAMKSGDTQLIFAREPVHKDFPKEEGVFFIYNKLLELEELSTEKIAETLINYKDFMKKHKIEIIKEFDTKSKLVYEGEIKNVKVDSFVTQSYFGFNKFQIIDGDTLSRDITTNSIAYLKPIDFTYALDSNAASYFSKYCLNKDNRYKALYSEILSDENNIDIQPYIFEVVMHGLRDFGINYKLNKKNKNETQMVFFETLKILHKEGLFREKKEKIWINNIIKKTNKLIEYYGTIGFMAHIFLFTILEAKYKFPKSCNKIQDYVYTELRKAKVPIENRFKAILYLFTDAPGHPFFNKTINVHNIRNFEKYIKDVDNTGRDIAISLLDRYTYGRAHIFPFLATDDQGFVKMFQDTKPDYIFKYNDLGIPVNKRINMDIQKKHLNFFETDSAKKGVFYIDGTFKELMETYKKKKNDFINLITSEKVI